MKLSTLIAGLCIVLITSAGLALNPEYIPEGGVIIPLGEQSDIWNTGYYFSVTGYNVTEEDVNFGLRGGFARMNPNGKELLESDGREYALQRNDGWRGIGELSAVVKWQPLEKQFGLMNWFVDGGLGAYYVRSSDVVVKGFTTEYTGPFSNTALSREIYRSEDSGIVPGVSASLGFNIMHRVRPTIRFQHLFVDDGMSTLILNLGLLAH